MSGPRVLTTIRQLEGLIERIREHRGHTQVSPVYREALLKLCSEALHAADCGKRGQDPADRAPAHPSTFWPSVGPNGELPSSWTPSDRLVGIEYDVFMGDADLADRLDRLEQFIGLQNDARGES